MALTKHHKCRPIFRDVNIIILEYDHFIAFLINPLPKLTMYRSRFSKIRLISST